MEKSNKSFVRWQGRSIQQLGFVNNLLMGLSTAIFIFLVKIVFDKTIALCETNICFFSLSIVSIVISIIAGCITAWIRLKDFHITSMIARKRETGKRDSIDIMRDKSKQYGSTTWIWLRIQALFFMFGLIPLLISSLITLFE